MEGCDTTGWPVLTEVQQDRVFKLFNLSQWMGLWSDTKFGGVVMANRDGVAVLRPDVARFLGVIPDGAGEP